MEEGDSFFITSPTLDTNSAISAPETCASGTIISNLQLHIFDRKIEAILSSDPFIAASRSDLEIALRILYWKFWFLIFHYNDNEFERVEYLFT